MSENPLWLPGNSNISAEASKNFCIFLKTLRDHPTKTVVARRTLLSRAEFFVWRKQFSGNGFPGLPSMVRLARNGISLIRRLRRA